MDNKNNTRNTIYRKLQYIKINKKNKIEVFEEMDYHNEIKNLINTMECGEQNIGDEINKFFQYILPENKEGDLLKVNIAISNKSKKNKPYIYECINNIMNMKETNNLTLTKDFSQQLSEILKEVYRTIKKNPNIKTYNDLLAKARESLYSGDNIIKKYMVEKIVNVEVSKKDDDDDIGVKNNSKNNVDNVGLKDYNYSSKNISRLNKYFREEKILEFQFKELKEEKKEILPIEMRLLLKKFSVVKKVKLTINNNNSDNKKKKKENFKLDSNDIQNNILVLFNLDWLFQNLLELEVDLSNVDLLKSQLGIYAKNLQILSDLLNKDIRLSIYHSGIYKNVIYNPYQLSNFHSSSPQLKDEDYLYLQQNINDKNSLTYFNNFNKEIESKNQAINKFIINYKNILEMIIIYGYFVSKMSSIRMCDFILPLNLEDEILAMLKKIKICLADFHFLSFYGSNQIFHFNINFNCLDNQSFEKVLIFIYQNTEMKICRINFFQSEEYFKPEILYKLLQNSNRNYANFFDFSYNDKNYYIYDLKPNEDLDEYLLRKLSDSFQKNIINLFYLLTLRTNINELSLIFNLPTILQKNDYYNIIIMKFLLNLFIFIDSNDNNLDTLSIQAEKFVFDSRKYIILYNFVDKLSLCNNPKNKIKNLTYQVIFYKIVNIHKIIPYQIEYLSLGSFDLETLKAFVNYITSSDFCLHSSLKKFQINLNNCLINYEECKEYIIKLLIEYPKNVNEINIYSHIIIDYYNLISLLLKTNYNTVENIFFQFNIKSLNDNGYRDMLANKEMIDKAYTFRNYFDLYYVIRRKKDTNKILNIMNRISMKINPNFSDYNIFSNLEKFMVNNKKKLNVLQFK